MHDVTGRFYVNRYDMDKFMDMYCEYIYTRPDSRGTGVAEILPENMPVIVDIDIKAKISSLPSSTDSSPPHLCNMKHIHAVINAYYHVILSIYQNISKEDLICVILEKTPYLVDDGKIVKNGFHLHFPRLFVNIYEQQVHVVTRVAEIVKSQHIFQDIESFVEPVVIDSHIYSSPWLLYGSQKNPDSGTYKATCAVVPYSIECRDYCDYRDTRICDISLTDAFSNIEWKTKSATNIEWYLPRLLSVLDLQKNVCKTLRNRISCPVKEVRRVAKSVISDNGNLYTVDEGLQIAEYMIDMISDARATEYDDWMRIGWALYNISHGGSKGCDLWIKFSRRDVHKFNESRCVTLWRDMNPGRITLGTLRYYAYLDNPEKYLERQKKSSDKCLRQSLLSSSHYDIAKLLCNEYGVTFACISYTKKLWVHFENHIWNYTEDGIALRQKISTDILSKYEKYYAMLKLEVSRLRKIQEKKGDGKEDECDEDDSDIDLEESIKPKAKPEEPDYEKDIDSLEDKIAAMKKIIHNLKTNPFKTAVMKECQEVFYNEMIADKLNTNPHLIAFTNGVYDVKEGIFREGRPEDFLSTKLPIQYKQFDEDGEEIHNIREFFSKIFPDSSVRKYFYDVMCDVFDGINSRKHVYIWTGEGDNGKSVTQLLFEKMLGKLSAKPPTSLITGKRGMSSSASPEYARLGDGVRWVTFDEPEKRDVINTGIMKQLSGNDTFYARRLYSDGAEITPMFKMCLICLSEGTPVSLASGISVPIEQLYINSQMLLSYDKNTNGIISTSQVAFEPKGERECVDIILLDGRRITCTPNHKFLTKTNNGEAWIQASDMKQDDRLIMGIDNPLCDINNCVTCNLDGRNSCNSSEYCVSHYSFNTQYLSDRLKGMSLFRLLGYFVTNEYLMLDNKIDNETMMLDIKALDSSKIPNTHVLPSSLQKAITSTLNNYSDIVGYPVIFVREFVSAFLGTCELEVRDDKVAFTLKTSNNSVKLILTMVSDWLRDAYGIDNNCVCVKSRGGYTCVLYVKNLIRFVKTIGLRYNYNKSYILTGLCSFYGYRDLGNKLGLNEYLSLIGLSPHKKSKDFLPTYTIPIVSIESVGMRQVYDITVEEPYSNFLANGAVSHNCNQLPVLPYDDKAVWNRIRVIPFESTFVDYERKNDPQYNDVPNVFVKDDEITDRLPAMTEALAWFLLEHRKKRLELREPTKILDVTRNYRTRSDLYRQFINESTEECVGKNITIRVLYEAFKEWYRMSYPGHQVPIRIDVEEYFAKLWKMNDEKTYFKDHVLKGGESENDDDNGDEIVL
jgi:phage/plasmid-associated DNA primase